LKERRGFQKREPKDFEQPSVYKKPKVFFERTGKIKKGSVQSNQAPKGRRRNFTQFSLHILKIWYNIITRLELCSLFFASSLFKKSATESISKNIK
jgi:hypothetical protein